MTHRSPLIARLLVLALVAAITSLVVSATASAAVFNPVADSYIDANRPTTNFGSRLSLRSDSTPLRVSYLKFNVVGFGSSTSAALKLYAVKNHSTGVELFVTDTSWDESRRTRSREELFQTRARAVGGPAPVGHGRCGPRADRSAGYVRIGEAAREAGSAG